MIGMDGFESVEKFSCVKCNRLMADVELTETKCPDCDYNIIKSFLAWSQKMLGKEYGKQMAIEFIKLHKPEFLKELE